MVYNKSDIKINVLSIINNKDDEKKTIFLGLLISKIRILGPFLFK